MHHIMHVLDGVDAPDSLKNCVALSLACSLSLALFLSLMRFLALAVFCSMLHLLSLSLPLLRYISL